MAEHNETGKAGEEIAFEYLINLGWKVVEQNYRFGKAEIDIIAIDGPEIVFVEVKTRSSNRIMEPEFAVNRTKQKLIIGAADFYIRKNKISQWARFDILSVVVHPQGKEIRLMKNAYTAY